MTGSLSPQAVFGLVDLGVVLILAVLLLVGYLRGFLRAQLATWYAQVIIAGLFLAVLAHIWEIGYNLLYYQGPGTSSPFGGSFFSVERIHFLISLAGFVVIAIGASVALRRRQHSETEVIDARHELEVSRYFEYQAEERFRYLFSSTTNSVYCFRFDPPMPIDLPIAEQVRRSYDAVLQDCNVNFARELGAEEPSAVLGKRLGDLDSSKDTISHEDYFATFVQNDYRLEGYDFEYRAPDRNWRSLHINMVGVIRAGLLHRMWAVESNTTQLRETQAALAQRRRFQELVASISSRLVMALEPDVDATIEQCMQDACEYVNADRSTLFWLIAEDNAVEVAYIWSPDGNPFGKISLERLPNFGAELKALRTVRIDDVSQLPEEFTKEQLALEQWNIKSLVVLPMVVSGQAVGGMTCGRLQRAAAWKDHEIEDLRVIAELFASFVLRLKSRRALDTALQQLQQATNRLQAENVYLRQEIELTHGFDEIIGRCDAMLHSLQLVEQVAPTKAPVLIIGETGTGKELIARAIHDLSDRRARPLVKINCAALPAALIESELFGYEKGAFTGADGNKQGRFDLANDSTLFLDEIGEIPVELQAKLLRVLQEGEFERLGSGKTIKVDVRLVVATNRDLAEAVLLGDFRSDLYYRINTFPIELPALRDRGDDIDLLTEHFVRVHAPRFSRDVSQISAEMMDQVRRYHWPGNVRELEGIVQRALISTTGSVLQLAEPLVTSSDTRSQGLRSVSDLKRIEKEHIVAVLEDTAWKISGDTGAAVRLGIPPSTLRSKMKKLAIERPH